jgi:hypothetical protein
MPTSATAAPPVLEPLRDPGSRAATRVFCVLAAIADLVPGPHPLAEITARPRWGATQRGRPGPGLGRSPRARMLELAAPHPALPVCVAAEPGRSPELAGLLAVHHPAIDAPRSVRLGAACHGAPRMAGAQADQGTAQCAPATRSTDAQRAIAALARHLTTHAAYLQSVLAAPSRDLAA